MNDVLLCVYIVRLRKMEGKPCELGWLGDNISGATLVKLCVISAWAFGFNQRFGSVLSVFQNFGFQKMTPDRFVEILKTDQFRFGFLVRFFG